MEFPKTMDMNLEANAIDGLLTKMRNKYDVEHNGLTISREDVYDNSDFDFALRLSKLKPDFQTIKQFMNAGVLFERNYDYKILDSICSDILVIKSLMDLYIRFFSLRNQFIKGKPQYIASNKVMLIHMKLLKEYAVQPELK